MSCRSARPRLLHAAFLRFVLLLLLCVLAAAPAARANWLFSYPPNQVKLDSGKRNNVFLVGDPVQFSLDIFNYGTYNSPGTLHYEVRDYWGNVAASGTVPSPLPNGPTTLLLPTITQPGWYKLYLHQSAAVSPWGDSVGGTMFVILRQSPNFPVEPSEYLPNNSGSSDGGDEVSRGVLGMGPQRHAVTDASQPAAAIASLAPSIAQDKQYYTPYDPQRSRPLLIAFPNGVGASDPAQQAANLAGLTQIVQQFHGDVKYWEPLNEPNYTYSGADYVTKELIPFYKAVKAVDPSCKVLGPGIVTIGPNGLTWIEDFLKAGGANYIDGFSFHAYNNVNGDLTLARESLDNLNILLTKYGVGNIEKWQTEQGYFAAVYGAYQPRLQGRWTMLQMMVYEQYGIPKEHNHLWYDKSHGFWDFPAFWENEDGLNSYGSFDPAAPLMRVWSEELYGTNFQSAYNLGALGNKLYIGDQFGGPGKQVAAFQSAGRTDGSLTLNVSGGASLHVVSAFGVASDIPVAGGQAVLPVPELPVYVELAAGQTIQPVPVDYGADLALTPGTVATTSGSGVSPLDPSYPNPISKIINGTLENWYYSQQNGDHDWMGNDASLPAWVQITLPQPMTISHAVVYAGVPWQSDGSLLDYELQYDQNGQWVTLSHPVEPTNVVDFFTSAVFCTADSFYSDRDVFVHDFAPVTTQKVRLLVHDVTWGGGPTQDIVAAGGQTGPHQITLREIELYGPAGQTAPPAPTGGSGTGLTGQYFNDVSLSALVKTEVDPSVNFTWNGSAPNAALTPNNFSVRWTGQVQPLYSQTYQFSTVSDDGVRLWVNGQEIINDWTDHAPTTDAGTITLTAGQKYDIKMEYYQRGGGATAQLSWQSPSQAPQIIPQAQLYPAAAAPAPPAPTPYGGSPVTVTSSGATKIEAENYDLGGEGVAYHDTVNGGCTAYRADNIGVTALGGTSNGNYVTWTGNGEWDGYTLSVAAAGTYTLTALIGSPTPGGTFHVEFGPVGQVGGAGVVKTGEFTVPNTGGYTTFQPVSVAGIALPAGNLWMRLVIDSTYPCTFDDFTLAPASPPAPVLTSIAVSPNTAALSAGGTQQFSAVGYDQNGVALSPQPTFAWSVASGGVGTVSASGLYAAGMTAGSAAVQVVSGGVSASAAITVTAPAPAALGTVSFYPRVGSANRMQGGQFQGSADGVNYVTLYTIPGVPADSQWTSAPLSADPKTYRYLRYVSPIGGWGNVSEVQFYSGTGASAVKLTGTPFGSPGSYNNDGNTFAKVFDGDTTSFFDGPAANGNFAGIDQGGTSTPVPTPVPTSGPVYQINAGGPVAGAFSADTLVSGGSIDSAGAATAIDLSGAATPAPAAVYQSERWGVFTYTLPKLTPGASYTLRLHFAEVYFGPGMPGGGGVGTRVFNVAINGASALSSFDILAAAGGPNKAVVKTFPVTADANGSVTVSFTNGSANSPKLSGLELLH